MAAEDVLKIDKVKGEPGEIVEFGEVLVVGGDSVTLGAPTVAGATVVARCSWTRRGVQKSLRLRNGAERIRAANVASGRNLQRVVDDLDKLIQAIGLKAAWTAAPTRTKCSLQAQ